MLYLDCTTDGRPRRRSTAVRGPGDFGGRHHRRAVCPARIWDRIRCALIRVGHGLFMWAVLLRGAEPPLPSLFQPRAPSLQPHCPVDHPRPPQPPSRPPPPAPHKSELLPVRPLPRKVPDGPAPLATVPSPMTRGGGGRLLSSGTRPPPPRPRDTHNQGTEMAMKAVRQARLELSGGSTPDLWRPPGAFGPLLLRGGGGVAYKSEETPPPPLRPTRAQSLAVEDFGLLV